MNATDISPVLLDLDDLQTPNTRTVIPTIIEAHPHAISTDGTQMLWRCVADDDGEQQLAVPRTFVQDEDGEMLDQYDAADRVVELADHLAKAAWN